MGLEDFAATVNSMGSATRDGVTYSYGVQIVGPEEFLLTVNTTDSVSKSVKRISLGNVKEVIHSPASVVAGTLKEAIVSTCEEQSGASRDLTTRFWFYTPSEEHAKSIAKSLRRAARIPNRFGELE